jgi:D-alanine-D-alanine ligase
MPAERPTRLVVVFGGESAEHEVSCVTAGHVLEAAAAAGYCVEPIGITAQGQWVRAEDAMTTLRAGAGELPAGIEAKGPEVAPTTAIVASDDEQVVVLPLLHGPLGEDGTIQGLLEMADVPYVGAGVLGSSLAMDKAAAKEVTAFHGIPQAGWRTVHRGIEGDSAELDRMADDLGFPLFVKPANMGSSIGVTKAHDRAELAGGLEHAFDFDDVAVVEEGIDGREIEIAVMGNHELSVSVPGEIRPGAEFYDYDDKYDDGAELVIPAPLSEEALSQIEDLARRSYRALRIEGMGRVDFFYEEDGRGWLLNEINTIPGFTPISQFPKLWAATGVPYEELIDRLVQLAVERHERRRRTRAATRSS